MSDSSTPLANPSTELPSKEAIALLVDPMRERFRREARVRFYGCLIFGLLFGLLVLAAGLSDNQFDLGETLAMAIMLSLLVGLCPGVAWRALVLSDLGGIEWIIQTGTVYPATLSGAWLDRFAAAAVSGTRSSPSVAVQWEMNGRSYSASFFAFDFKPPVEQVAVVAAKRRKIVVVLNGKLYGASR